MRCQDISISACQERPLCPCFQEWDRQVRPNEIKVQLLDAAAVVVAVTLVIGAGVDLLAKAVVRRVCDR